MHYFFSVEGEVLLDYWNKCEEHITGLSCSAVRCIELLTATECLLKH
jgi:hypothetical protein